MSKCEFSAFDKFDLAGCAHSLAFGWIPDWVWMIAPYWPWVVIVGGAGMAYRHAGWPGVAAFAGGVGFIAGRKSVKAPKDQHEHVTGHDAAPPISAPKKKRPTIFDR